MFGELSLLQTSSNTKRFQLYTSFPIFISILFQPSDRDGNNVADILEQVASKGVPKNKIHAGVPLYGQTFRLRSTFHGVDAPTDGRGEPGEFTMQGGMLAYYEICSMSESMFFLTTQAFRVFPQTLPCFTHKLNTRRLFCRLQNCKMSNVLKCSPSQRFFSFAFQSTHTS